MSSEHYYLHVEPSIEVLATTRFPLVSYYHVSNKPVDMPVIWTKFWGNGRVFYNSLGHHDEKLPVQMLLGYEHIDFYLDKNAVSLVNEELIKELNK